MIGRTRYSDKRYFYFSLSDDTKFCAKSEEDIYGIGLDSEEETSRIAQLRNHLEMESNYERKWRNAELSNTDRFMIPDCTYKGKEVAGTTIYSDIVAYRKALRAYDLKYHPRPVAPKWFNG